MTIAMSETKQMIRVCYTST